MHRLCSNPRLVTTRRTATGGGPMLEANAIVNNNTEYNSFILAEGTLSKSSARAKISFVAQHRANANCAALSYVNATEKKH